MIAKVKGKKQNKKTYLYRKVSMGMGRTKSPLPAEPTRTGLAIGPEIGSFLSHRRFLNGPALQECGVKII